MTEALVVRREVQNILSVAGRHVARGGGIEVIPVHCLAYSSDWEGSRQVPPASSLMEIDLIEEEGAFLRLNNSGLPDRGNAPSMLGARRIIWPGSPSPQVVAIQGPILIAR